MKLQLNLPLLIQFTVAMPSALKAEVETLKEVARIGEKASQRAAGECAMASPPFK